MGPVDQLGNHQHRGELLVGLRRQRLRQGGHRRPETIGEVFCRTGGDERMQPQIFADDEAADTQNAWMRCVLNQPDSAIIASAKLRPRSGPSLPTNTGMNR